MTSSGRGEDPTPPDIPVVDRPDDPDDEAFGDPASSVEVVPPVSAVSVDRAEPSVEPPQEYPGTASGADHVDVVDRRMTVHGLFRMPDLKAAVTGVSRVTRRPARTLHETYFDTADFRLARWQVSVCNRQGGEDEGWHLVMPVTGHDGDLQEIRIPPGAGEDEVPGQLADLVVGLRRNADLQSVAAIRTERTEYLLSGQGHKVRVLDDTVSVLDGDQIAARFREVEVVATDAAPWTDAIASTLVAAGATPGATSAAMTALGPVTQGPADVPDPEDVGPHDPAGAAVTAHIRRHARALILQDIRVRLDLPDGVHQMRVAARRLRSGLKVFEPLVELEWAQQLRDELGWVAGELGVSRDTEVLMARLDSHADDIGAQYAPLIRGVVDPALSAQSRDARSHALAAMTSQRYKDFLDLLVASAQKPPLTELAADPSGHVLPKLVDRAWRKLRKEVSLLEMDGPSEPWHEARIRAKKARYAAEAVAPVLGDRLKQFGKALAEVTEVLGEHQDAWVAQQTLQSLAAAPDVTGDAGFALGLLHQYELRQEMLDRKHFIRLWPSIKRSHKKAQLD